MVDRDGNYCGGVIAPGINLSLQALEMAAAKLPQRARSRRTERVIGTSTVACMQSGIFWGYVGLVEGIVAAHRRGASARRWMSSPPAGLAPLFAGVTEVIDHVDPDLTLWGLRLIYRPKPQRNESSARCNRGRRRNTATKTRSTFVPLGGAGEIGMNLNVYGYRGRLADDRLRRHLRRRFPARASKS